MRTDTLILYGNVQKTLEGLISRFLIGNRLEIQKRRLTKVNGSPSGLDLQVALILRKIIKRYSLIVNEAGRQIDQGRDSVSKRARPTTGTSWQSDRWLLLAPMTLSLKHWPFGKLSINKTRDLKEL